MKPRRTRVRVTNYVLDLVLPAVNRLLAPEGFRIVREQKVMRPLWLVLERLPESTT